MQPTGEAYGLRFMQSAGEAYGLNFTQMADMACGLGKRGEKECFCAERLNIIMSGNYMTFVGEKRNKHKCSKLRNN